MQYMCVCVCVAMRQCWSFEGAMLLKGLSKCSSRIVLALKGGISLERKGQACKQLRCWVVKRGISLERNGQACKQ